MKMNLFSKSIVVRFKGLSSFFLISAGLLLQSCSKDPAPVPELAYLSITNTSPTPATFNIYVDQTRINTGGAVSFGGSSGYLQMSPGSHNIKFTTASSLESVFAKNISLEVNTVTSLFLIDKEANMDFLQVKDEIGNLTSTKAFVRFINLSPDAPALDLAIKDGAVVIADKSYKTSSVFVEIEAKTYIFEFRNKTSQTTTTLESTEFKAGKSYTIISTGLISPGDTGQPFGSKIILNQ